MFDTAIAGSLPKPAWLAETQKLWPQWKAEGPELQQAKLDATLLWIKAQEDAGLDVIGDGEMSRASTSCTASSSRSRASTSSTRSRWASAPTATRRWCRRWCRR